MFEIGQKVELIYPQSTNVFQFPNAIREVRQLTIRRVRDLFENPLTVDEFMRRPFISRSRWLILANEENKPGPKQFYVGSSDNYRAPGTIRLALFEPDAKRPSAYIGPQIEPTVLWRKRLIRLIRQEIDRHPKHLLRIVADDLRLRA